MGCLANTTIQVLVDSGSSLNFIQSCLASHLHLPIDSVPHFSIGVGNDQKLYSDRCVRQASIIIQGFVVTTYLFVLPIEGVDVVLSVAWLSTLGKIVHGYQAFIMQFATNAHMVELHGEGTLLKGPVQFHSLRPMFKTLMLLSL